MRFSRRELFQLSSAGALGFALPAGSEASAPDEVPAPLAALKPIA